MHSSHEHGDDIPHISETVRDLGNNCLNFDYSAAHNNCDSFDEHDYYQDAEQERFLLLEEAYYDDCSYSSRRKIKTKRGKMGKKSQTRRSNPLHTSLLHGLSKTNYCNYTKQKSTKENRRFKKKLARREVQLEQLRARKANIHERVKHLIKSCHDCDESYQSYPSFYYDPRDYGVEVLPAKDLGVDEGSMYNRLLSILQGDDITPEDYELLLQLDSNNAKSTLEEESINNIPVMIIGGVGEGGIAFEEIERDHCEICLEPWILDSEVRRLPCKHVFCKECIDHWLKNVSQKCPALSCYWCKENGN